MNGFPAQPEADRDSSSRACGRVLIVSYYYPPRNVIASLRTGKLSKYLSSLGWEPWVLTLEDGLFASAGALPVEIPEDRVIRAGLGRILTPLARNRSARRGGEAHGQNAARTQQANRSLPARLLQLLWQTFSAQFGDIRFPDRALPWCMPAIKRGSALLRAQSFDAIFSSHGPPSSHLVGAALARRFNLPWVADYRDLWSQNHIERRGRLTQRLETRFERWVVRHAKHLTTISEPMAQELRMLHAKPVSVLLNGFDEDDFKGVEGKSKADKFTIVYTGMIYPGKRDPSVVFQAVRALMNRDDRLRNDVELHFLGSDPSLVYKLAENCGVRSQVMVHPRSPHREALQWQAGADMLLLLEWQDPSAKGVYTGKVFEYLGAQRPILATGPAGGVIEALLEDTQSGELVADVNDATRLISHWLDVKRHVGSTRLSDRRELLLPYTRRHQAGVLAEVLSSSMRSARACA